MDQRVVFKSAKMPFFKPRLVAWYLLMLVSVFSMTSYLFSIQARFLIDWNTANQPPSVLYILGIFTTASLRAERIIHRETYLRSPWVCNQVRLRPPNTENNSYNRSGDECAHAYFIIGRITDEYAQAIREENATYGDILELDIDENMNQGKTVQYFIQAAGWFPDAQFIGKSDMDTFVMVERMMTDIQDTAKGGRRVYGGRMVDYRYCGSTPNKCPIGWVYMAGECYFLSQDLVQFIAEPGNPVTKANFKGTSEDIHMGKLLRQSGLIVSYVTWPHKRMPWVHTKNLTHFYELNKTWPNISYSGLAEAPPYKT